MPLAFTRLSTHASAIPAYAKAVISHFSQSSLPCIVYADLIFLFHDSYSQRTIGSQTSETTADAVAGEEMSGQQIQHQATDLRSLHTPC